MTVGEVIITACIAWIGAGALYGTFMLLLGLLKKGDD